ncbi:MAG: hypothetical protein WB994_01325, partial [Candidatus Acidiferrum sp.]
LGITTLPSTSTGDSTVAVNVWPVSLIFDPTVSSSTTAIHVSVRTTMGIGFASASRLEEPSRDGEEEDDAVEGDDASEGDDAASELAA